MDPFIKLKIIIFNVIHFYIKKYQVFTIMQEKETLEVKFKREPWHHTLQYHDILIRTLKSNKEPRIISFIERENDGKDRVLSIAAPLLLNIACLISQAS